MTEIPIVRKPCYFWPLGQCTKGDECPWEHNVRACPSLLQVTGLNVSQGQLDPGLEDRDSPLCLPNEVGEACNRCLERFYSVRSQPLKYILSANSAQCDKKGRGGQNDPCSECRWFGGANCICTLNTTSSYNDKAWHTMINRGPQNFYSLPDYKPRHEGSWIHPPKKSGLPKVRSTPEPMPAEKIKADWKGASRAELLARVDMLHPDVRARPRSYVVPPRDAGVVQKVQAFNKENKGKRKRQSDVNVSPAAGASTAPPQLPEGLLPPKEVPGFGQVTDVSYSYETLSHKFIYSSGALLELKWTVPSTSDVRDLYLWSNNVTNQLQQGNSQSIGSTPGPAMKKLCMASSNQESPVNQHQNDQIQPEPFAQMEVEPTSNTPTAAAAIDPLGIDLEEDNSIGYSSSEEDKKSEP